MADEPTNGELQRVFESGKQELAADIAQLQERLSLYVLKEVYEVQRAADLDRVARMEAELAEQRERNHSRKLTTISSFIAPIVVSVILTLLLQGLTP